MVLQQEVMASPFSFTGDPSETKPSTNPILNGQADISPVKVITTDVIIIFSVTPLGPNSETDFS